MGREIRRVPKGWEHPRDRDGNFIPMHDQPYKKVLDGWIRAYHVWDGGILLDGTKGDAPYWEAWGPPPDPDRYRPAFDSEPMCYQIYETVSEGTPISPVFETIEKLVDWIVEQGHSRRARSVSRK